jgi:hypothetical protein
MAIPMVVSGLTVQLCLNFSKKYLKLSLNSSDSKTVVLSITALKQGGMNSSVFKWTLSRHSGSLLAGIQPDALSGFRLKDCRNDEWKYRRTFAHFLSIALQERLPCLYNLTEQHAKKLQRELFIQGNQNNTRVELNAAGAGSSSHINSHAHGQEEWEA